MTGCLQVVGCCLYILNPCGLCPPTGNHRVRAFTLADGQLTTLAGIGQTWPLIDGTGGLGATFNSPSGG